MRAEELRNEAKLYDAEGRCYVHIEGSRVGTSDTMSCIVAGEESLLLTAACSLIEGVVASPGGVLDFRRAMRTIRRLHRNSSQLTMDAAAKEA